MEFIGLDIGTTGAKALLVDETGRVLGKGYVGYALDSNGPRVEQRADDWTECGAQAIRQALAGHEDSKVAAVSLSTQGASTVAVDAEGHSIGRALTWMDTRATEEAAFLVGQLGDDYIYRHTGWRTSPALDAAKIMHMKQSGSFPNAVRFLSTLEYANQFLTGNPLCDPSNASMRQFYHLVNQDYDDRILETIGLSRHELPAVAPAGTPVGRITPEAAGLTGLPAGTPVFNGAHDQYCASLGAGAIQKGDMLLSAGTTWVIMGIDDKPLFTPSYIAPGIHPIPGLYGAIASLVGNGASLQWFKNEFANEDFREIDRMAASRASQAQDLFFYPYLSGAHYPVWDLKARGAFTGICLEHNRYDFARAIMEGAAFGVRRALDDFSANGSHIRTLKILGGAARSELWCTLIAAAANVPVEIPDESDACALGAAMIAAHGAGAYASLHDAAAAMATPTRHQQPDPDMAATLNEKYTRYRKMWDGIAQGQRT